MTFDTNTLLAVGSIVTALATAAYQLRKQRIATKIQHTIDLLSHTFEDNPVSIARSKMRHWRLSGRSIRDDSLTPTEDEVVITVLNYYDFLASLILIDDLDMRVFKKTFGGVVVRDFEYLSGYVQARRHRLKRPQLYMNLETICEAHLRGCD